MADYNVKVYGKKGKYYIGCISIFYNLSITSFNYICEMKTCFINSLLRHFIVHLHLKIGQICIFTGVLKNLVCKKSTEN